MKVRTSQLEGKQLDWAVARATKADACLFNGRIIRPMYRPNHQHNSRYEPSRDWSQVGPLIERYRLCVDAEPGLPRQWSAHDETRRGVIGFGDTALIAVCRAIVAIELGKTVSLPDELEGAL